MINIDELRQRVEAAEQRFGMADSSQRQSSEKLIGMMDAIEQDQAQKQIALEETKALVASMALENQQLRGMLQSLLLAIEAAGDAQSVEILRQMDSKLTAMVEAAAPTMAAATTETAEIPATPEGFGAVETPEMVETPEVVVTAVADAAEVVVTDELPAAVEVDEALGAAEVGEMLEAAGPEVDAGAGDVETVALAPAEIPADDDVLPEPPGVLPRAAADSIDDEVVSIAAEESASGAAESSDEAANGDAANGGTGNGEATGDAGRRNIDAASAANGVREILLRMNKEKRQQEVAARSQS